MPWSTHFGVDFDLGSPSRNQDPFDGGSSSRIGGGTPSGRGIGGGISSGNGIGGGTLNGAKFKMEGMRKKKVRLGKNFLFIDRNLRQNLKDIDAFQLIHPWSLPVVKVQTKRPFKTDMEVDILDVSNIEVQPSTSISCEDTHPQL
ncbi:hypothetical protein LOK49_Contig132G00009 [Camellia lanceoleosa]|nr:hypothetical protein LOK49_Contig132G00009 [Camellia lanceoleosa]